jgi:hypothetical protein
MVAECVRWGNVQKDGSRGNWQSARHSNHRHPEHEEVLNTTGQWSFWTFSHNPFIEKNKKFWEELISCFTFIRQGPHRKRCLQQFFVSAGTCLPSHCLATIGGYTVQSSKLLMGLASTVILSSESHKTHDHILLSDGSGSLQTTASALLQADPETLLWYDTNSTENHASNISSIVTCISCRGLLPSNDRGVHIQTHGLMRGIYEACCWDGLWFHDILYIPRFIDWFRHSKASGGIHRHTDSKVNT